MNCSGRSRLGHMGPKREPFPSTKAKRLAVAGVLSQLGLRYRVQAVVLACEGGIVSPGHNEG